MKKLPVFILTAALAVSLWFNWRNQPPISDPIRVPPGPVESAAPIMPVKLEEMDFSGTALADEAWKLPQGKADGKIPLSLSPEEAGPAKLPVGATGQWDPEVQLKLDSRP